MCEPTTIAIAGMAMSVLSTGVGAVAAKQQGEAAEAAANYQAQVGRNNAEIRRQDAETARQEGRIAAGERGLQSAADRARFIAAGAGAGVLIEGDTSIDDIAGDITGIGSVDQLTIAHNASSQARNLEIEATNLEAGANLDQFRGANAARAGRVKAVGSLLSGAGSVASKWSSFSKTTTNPGNAPKGFDQINGPTYF